MATGGLLAMRLGQIRRRLRLWSALEGAVLGGALAALALAAAVAIARGRGGAPAACEIAALLVAGAGTGAAARGARKIPLDRCARLADAALDGQDRLLSALYLDAAEPTPFARALVADAVRRVELLVPSAAAPARRPAGLPALALAVLALATAALFPTSSRAARVVPTTAIVDRRPPIPADTLAAEREAARAAAAEAARLADARLAALAAELDHTLRRLADGTLGDGAALDLLRALEARAAEAARDARRDGEAARAAARALEANAETRAAGKAISPTTVGPGDDERARDALAASATAHPAETARALSAAAENMTGATGEAGNAAGPDGKEDQRRLARDEKSAAAPTANDAQGASDPETRQLEQLRRDLDDAAAGCRAGDPSCGARAGQTGRDLARLGRQGAARDSLQRLERTAQQLRARIGRGELRDSDAQAMRSFGRAARGDDQARAGDGESTSAGTDTPSAGAEGAEAGEGAGASEKGDDGAARGKGAGTGAASAALGVEESGGSAEDAAGTGNGIGHQPGGPPLGARAADLAVERGSEAEVPLAEGAGPSRAEVIGTAAGRGFASRAYARAFADYGAAVEDALGASAVPEGKRYLVRRYFDLIRPRPPARAPRSRP